mmetsp:Transcript_4954/g.13834  ORF Transcript_4954/g.13834 Transcript_4954/m.13834 type:complete len:284 (-) Transcript_4954:1932-2783(-)
MYCRIVATPARSSTSTSKDTELAISSPSLNHSCLKIVLPPDVKKANSESSNLDSGRGKRSPRSRIYLRKSSIQHDRLVTRKNAGNSVQNVNKSRWAAGCLIWNLVLNFHMVVGSTIPTSGATRSRSIPKTTSTIACRSCGKREPKTGTCAGRKRSSDDTDGSRDQLEFSLHSYGPQKHSVCHPQEAALPRRINEFFICNTGSNLVSLVSQICSNRGAREVFAKAICGASVDNPFASKSSRLPTSVVSKTSRNSSLESDSIPTKRDNTVANPSSSRHSIVSPLL